MRKRIFEIDLLRFIAIIIMIAYHLSYDLNYYLGQKINLEGLTWTIIAKIGAFIFIFVSGISSGFSKSNVKRGAKVFLYGIVITIVTFIFVRTEYVRFGILHLLGFCMIIYPFLLRINSFVLVAIAAVSFYLGFVFDKMQVKTFLLLPLGLYYNGFVSIDYYPIFPYISFFITGILAYKLFYYKRKSLFKINYSFKLVEFVSKNSLVIYLVHQPIFISAIFLIKTIIKKQGI